MGAGERPIRRRSYIATERGIYFAAINAVRQSLHTARSQGTAVICEKLYAAPNPGSVDCPLERVPCHGRGNTGE